MKNFPKKVGYVIAIIILIVVSFISGAYLSRTYIKEGMIIEVDGGVVVVEDMRGERWAFIDDSYQIGKWVRMYMDNNGTDNIYDDEIIKVKILE